MVSIVHGEKGREREIAQERNSMHWIRRSVGCRVASHRVASRRLATRHSSLGVTAARFIASVNLRRLTSRRVSDYLPTYLPIRRASRRALQRNVPAQRVTALSPLSSALFPRERDARSMEIEMVSRCVLRYAKYYGAARVSLPQIFSIRYSSWSIALSRFCNCFFDAFHNS